MPDNEAKTTSPSPNRFDSLAKEFRTKIKDLATELKSDLRDCAAHVPEGQIHDIAELYANITLAYRHLEDSAMRLGKAIQARDGGSSVYDK